MKGRSLKGTDEMIKLEAIILECERTGQTPRDVCLFYTGLSVDQYLGREFNRVGFYQYEHQRHNYQKPKINFWEL